MLIINIAKFLENVRISYEGKTYVCPTQMINNELYFKFKNELYIVADYMYEY